MLTMNWFAINNDETKIEEGEGFPVDRDNLNVFGISVMDKGNDIGSFFYKADTGVFYLDLDLDLKFSLTVNDNVYELTNTDAKYNDCIAFQNYYFDMNSTICKDSKLRGYSFGYKTQIELDDCKIYFQPLLIINVNEKLMFRFKLLCDRDLDCKLSIILDGQEHQNVEVNLVKNISSKDIDIVL